MFTNKLSVRPLEKKDFETIVDYFLNSDLLFLLNMGVDERKLPSRDNWLKLLEEDYNNPIKEKKFYYLIWLLNNKPVGHSNLNKIYFGVQANMHIHLWDLKNRQKGIGHEFVKLSLPHFFENFKLKNLYCEPYAFNPAPNKVLKQLGFDFIKGYETIPGWINFQQKVNKWCLDYNKYIKLYGSLAETKL